MNGYYKHFEQPFNTRIRVYVEWRGAVGMVKIGNGSMFSSLTIFTIQRGFKEAIMVKDERGDWQRVEGVTAYDLTKRIVDYLTRIDDTKFNDTELKLACANYCAPTLEAQTATLREETATLQRKTVTLEQEAVTLKNKTATLLSEKEAILRQKDAELAEKDAKIKRLENGQLDVFKTASEGKIDRAFFDKEISRFQQSESEAKGVAVRLQEQLTATQTELRGVTVGLQSKIDGLQQEKAATLMRLQGVEVAGEASKTATQLIEARVADWKQRYETELRRVTALEKVHANQLKEVAEIEGRVAAIAEKHFPLDEEADLLDALDEYITHTKDRLSKYEDIAWKPVAKFARITTQAKEPYFIFMALAMGGQATMTCMFIKIVGEKLGVSADALSITAPIIGGLLAFLGFAKATVSEKDPNDVAELRELKGKLYEQMNGDPFDVQSRKNAIKLDIRKLEAKIGATEADATTWLWVVNTLHFIENCVNFKVVQNLDAEKYTEFWSGLIISVLLVLVTFWYPIIYFNKIKNETTK